ncbi:MAG: hypothetical protein GY856_05560, partial [bacterium]|nr:hypothetical protein [bacterium]
MRRTCGLPVPLRGDLGFSSRILTLAMLLLFLGAVTASSSPAEVVWSYQPHEVFTPRAPEQPPVPIELILDDGSFEGDFGISGVGLTAKQFLWFNQFDLTGGVVTLEQIWVLFPPGPNMAVGNAVQLVVYHDPDSDPTNGGTLLATWDGTIQAIDGLTFSTYPLAAPLTLPSGGDALVGVISRFVDSHVTSSTNPASLDTSASQGRSWVAVWTGDPP